ncbi:PepSY-associated TM helix domain-containing protein [Nostoc sp.]|uniref:PepSY-associated TM helix domain-containing protein n=1 Tax=Nostoc sp. TaxID=1180 RepID=UPI002FF69D0B
MNFKKIRNLIFTLHRYIGFSVGLLLIVIGLTGSLLVFQKEINHFLVAQQFGQITPQQTLLSPDSIVNTVKAAYASRTDLKLAALYMPSEPNASCNVELADAQDKGTEVLVNPYTGAILGERLWDNTLFGIIYQLHYALLAGQTGTIIVGIAALLMCILSITGVLLWPGWRKLISGFKIKWNAHPKRVNFDLHKVVGIVVATFVLLTFFTGFCWNFSDFSTSLIRAVTFSPSKTEPVSQPITGQSALQLTNQLQTAQAALPGAKLQTIYFPSKPESTLWMRYKFPQELGDYGNSYVYLDQYSGKVLRVDNGLEPSLGDRVLNSFTPLHYGTFGGLPTRILYVFVGLAPLILFITGFVMWRYRKRPTTNLPTEAFAQK